MGGRKTIPELVKKVFIAQNYLTHRMFRYVYFYPNVKDKIGQSRVMS